MDAYSHLHDDERLLFAVRPSRAAFLGDRLLSLLVPVFLVVVLFGPGRVESWAMIAGVVLAVFAAGTFIRWRQWRSSLLRATTERILVQFPTSPLSHPQKTIKWSQYQESYVGHAGPMALLTGVRPLTIRYGSPDAPLTVTFPPIGYAADIKHYLDKADSMLRKGQAAGLRSFVHKPRGQRDGEVVSPENGAA